MVVKVPFAEAIFMGILGVICGRGISLMGIICKAKVCSLLISLMLKL